MPRSDVCIELMSLITDGFLSLPSGRSEPNAIRVVQEVAGGKIITIEGNTNVEASPEGIGVFRRESRKAHRSTRVSSTMVRPRRTSFVTESAP